MFVLLEHRLAATADCAAGVHWDFLVEVPGQERLATWRLLKNPIGRTASVTAERIDDHRRVYLDYEGEISGGRGLVRRIDRGEAVLERCTERELRAVLHGERLRGEYEIVAVSTDRMEFRAAPARPEACSNPTT